jgi:hypothetical protein
MPSVTCGEAGGEGGRSVMGKTLDQKLLDLARELGKFKHRITLRELEKLRKWKLQAMTWSGYDFIQTRGRCNDV